MVFSSFVKKDLKKEKSARILVLGLDNAGKSTYVNHLLRRDTLEVAPTYGFHIHRFNYQAMMVTMWDVGGQRILRPFWKNYFEQTRGLIWVVDSTDLSRLMECKKEMYDTLTSDPQDTTVILILANKQDMPGALSTDRIIDVLNLRNHDRHVWRVHPTKAHEGEGVNESFHWLMNTIDRRSKF